MSKSSKKYTKREVSIEEIEDAGWDTSRMLDEPEWFDILDPSGTVLARVTSVEEANALLSHLNR